MDERMDGSSVIEPTWTSGDVTLYLGDCLEVLPTLAAGSVDAVVTDPPFCQPAAHYSQPIKGKRVQNIIGDTSILEHFFGSVIVASKHTIRSAGDWYIFCDGQSYPLIYRAIYSHVRAVRPLIWDKQTTFVGYTWRHQHELIAWARCEENKGIPTSDGDIIRCRAVGVSDRLHPAEKPVDLLSKIISKTPDSATILDPFMGSGTTGVACVQTRRKFVGIEIDPGYFEIAKKRISEAQAQGRLAI